ncbi:MAG: lipase [Podila humilis]|nr:MAG: lipase [Podila humilis]
MKFSTLILSTVVTLMASTSRVQAAALPTVDIQAATMPQFVKRDIAGLNNYNCKPSAAHPRPLILVHATLLTADSWQDFVPTFQQQGWCVFALTYGTVPDIPGFGGLAPVEQSAQQLADFANNVMARMNASQVDLVGHSQGGILGRYWVKYLGGAGKVNRMVGISPITHGTTLSGIATVAKALQVFYPAEPLFDKIAPSFYEMVNTSPFIAKLNAGGDTSPGVVHSNIATKFDEVVTPYQTAFENDPGVTNVVLQDLCLLSLNEHLTMVNSMVVLQYVLNQLDPSAAKTANCLSLL